MRRGAHESFTDRRGAGRRASAASLYQPAPGSGAGGGAGRGGHRPFGVAGGGAATRAGAAGGLVGVLGGVRARQRAAAAGRVAASPRVRLFPGRAAAVERPRLDAGRGRLAGRFVLLLHDRLRQSGVASWRVDHGVGLELLRAPDAGGMAARGRLARFGGGAGGCGGGLRGGRLLEQPVCADAFGALRSVGGGQSRIEGDEPGTTPASGYPRGIGAAADPRPGGNQRRTAARQRGIAALERGQVAFPLERLPRTPDAADLDPLLLRAAAELSR